MTDGDYFFTIFLGTITLARLLLLKKIACPTISGFRLRHYMYGIILIVLSFSFSNIAIFAVGLALLSDELPLIIVRGLGYREGDWGGFENYYEPWVVANVFVLLFAVYYFRHFFVQFF